MITKVSMSSVNKLYSSRATNPTFGMARLNSDAIELAKQYGFETHDYLDASLFVKPSLFDRETELSKKLAEGQDFVKLCEMYGCSNDGYRNLQFIENQVLHKKSAEAIKKLPEEVYIAGLTKLYEHNFDNPSLSAKFTEEMLNCVSSSMSIDKFVKNYGLLKVGTKGNREN